LTSQIFSNIYLNEFDRFVRHQLKPQAYVRYGDDFLLFTATRKQALIARNSATDFLYSALKLNINPKNNIVIAESRGLRFLGHDITNIKATVDKHTTSSVLQKLNSRNVSSYKVLYMEENAKKQLDWILLEKDLHE
jgi:RNA-directed DNA polymerase